MQKYTLGNVMDTFNQVLGRLYFSSVKIEQSNGKSEPFSMIGWSDFPYLLFLLNIFHSCSFTIFKQKIVVSTGVKYCLISHYISCQKISNFLNWTCSL